MPFVAICKECMWVTLSGKLRTIGQFILDHFELEHNRIPKPHPWRLNIEDFKSHHVFIDNFLTGGYYTFSSKIFYSYDYCIAIITHEDYNLYYNNDQSKLLDYFKSYFPDRALQKDKTMISIKEFSDISSLDNKELEDLFLHILSELKKRGLLERKQ